MLLYVIPLLHSTLGVEKKLPSRHKMLKVLKVLWGDWPPSKKKGENPPRELFNILSKFLSVIPKTLNMFNISLVLSQFLLKMYLKQGNF